MTISSRSISYAHVCACIYVRDGTIFIFAVVDALFYDLRKIFYLQLLSFNLTMVERYNIKISCEGQPNTVFIKVYQLPCAVCIQCIGVPICPGLSNYFIQAAQGNWYTFMKTGFG